MASQQEVTPLIRKSPKKKADKSDGKSKIVFPEDEPAEVKCIDFFCFVVSLFALVSTQYVVLTYHDHADLVYILWVLLAFILPFNEFCFETLCRAPSLCFCSFTFLMMVTQYIVSYNPHQLHGFYMFFFIWAVWYTGWAKSCTNTEFFLLDFPYFLSACWIISYFIGFTPYSLQVLFILSNGHAIGSIVLCGTRLAPHDVTLTSEFYINFMPAMISRCIRWYCPICHLQECKLDGGLGYMVGPLAMYLIWQMLYLLVTEVILRKHLSQPKYAVATSMRWAAKDENSRVTKFCRTVGIVSKHGVLNPTQWAKTVFIIMSLNFAYMCLIIAPVKFMYETYRVHITSLFGAFVWATLQGVYFYVNQLMQARVEKDAQADRVKECSSSESGSTETDSSDAKSAESPKNNRLKQRNQRVSL